MQHKQTLKQYMWAQKNRLCFYLVEVRTIIVVSQQGIVIR